MSLIRVLQLACGLTGAIGILFIGTGSILYAVPMGMVCLWLTERGR